MKILSRIYTMATTAALVGLLVAFGYEKGLNARYESGQLINASALQDAGYAQDWVTLVENAAK